MDSHIEIRPGRIIHVTQHQNPAADITLFLIHGLGGRGAQWDTLIAQLKPYYSLIIPDLLGHGQSDKPIPHQHNLYSFSELDRDLQTLFQRYAGERNIIIGHSYGGGLAASLTIDHQDKIDQAILLAPIPCAPFPRIPNQFYLPTRVMEWLRPVFEKMFKRMAFSKQADPQLVAREIEAGKANPMYVLKAMVMGLRSIAPIDITMLTVPTTLILCDQDNMVPVALSQHFYQAAPHHHFHVLKHASHMALLETPNVVNDIILKQITTHCRQAEKHMQ